jgi:L-iditol 2-dehydrogenase
VIGHELCGEMVETGAEMRDFELGQRVTVTPAIGCGRCPDCITGRSNLCTELKTIGFQFDGGFAELMEIPPSAFAQGNVNLVPEGLSNGEAALAEPIACVINGQELLHVGSGDIVAIFGSGFIGCLHAEMALLGGSEKVLMIGRNAAKSEQVKQLIPRITLVDSRKGDIREEILGLTSGRGVDVAIVACSSGAAQTDAVRIAANRARISLFGGLPGEALGFLDSNTIHYKELSINGAHASTPEQNRQALELIAQKKLDLAKYINKTYPLSKIETAFTELGRKKLFKIMVDPSF